MQTGRFLSYSFLFVLLAAVLSTDVSKSTPYLFADEAVYHAMTVSLAFDGDLVYRREDLQRVCRDFSAGPRGIILKKLDSGKIVYAKPFLYSLIAAPFYRIWHLNGFLVLNVLCWWGIFMILFRCWGGSAGAAVFAGTALVLSAFTPYVLWIHPEMFSAFLVVAFIGLWRSLKPSDPPVITRRKIMAMGAALAVAAWIKPPSILIGIALLVNWIPARRWNWILLTSAGCFMAGVLAVSTSLAFTGSLNPYSGERKIFNEHYPLESPGVDFGDTGNNWSTESAGFHFVPGVLLANLKFFWIGRFSGLVWYYLPGCFCLVLWLLGNRDRIGTGLLISLSTIILVHLVMIPTNYHGGGGALGNRYFTVYYPALLCILPRVPSPRKILLGCIPAALISGVYITQAFTASYRPGDHTQSGFFSTLPVEWTLTGSFPVFDPKYRMVRFPDCSAIFYFLDWNTFGGDNQGFWIRGDSKTRLIAELPENVKMPAFIISSAGIPITGTITEGGISQHFVVKTGLSTRIDFADPAGHELIDIYGRKRRIIPIQIQISGGTIPKFRENSADSRFLGAFCRPVGSIQTGRGLNIYKKNKLLRSMATHGRIVDPEQPGGGVLS
ncbi:hypothetical protein JXA40_03535 [bacterium]|nr:hypothetical protein [candidate division CSSED10-310 bacterium]